MFPSGIRRHGIGWAAAIRRMAAFVDGTRQHPRGAAPSSKSNVGCAVSQALAKSLITIRRVKVGRVSHRIRVVPLWLS